MDEQDNQNQKKSLDEKVSEKLKEIRQWTKNNKTLTLIFIIFFIIPTTISIIVISTKNEINWIGFGNDSNKSITVEKELNPTNVKEKFETEKGVEEGTVIKRVVKVTNNEQSFKTLWDWLELGGILAIPVLIALLSYQFQRRDQKRAEKQAQAEKDIANEDLRDDALQAYIDRMSELLLDKELAKSKSDSPVRDVARTRTLTVLRRLRSDGDRKAIVLLFLYDAGLLQSEGVVPFINLRDADFTGANLTKANLTRANLTEANLTEVNLTGANLVVADLTGAKLTEANFTRTNLTGANLTEVNLTGANLVVADLTGADLTGAKLIGADLTRAKLTRADFTGADLTGADLTGAKLIGADLTRAKLTRADFTGADLTRADLTGADLTGAKLTEADLTEADLIEADLIEADLTGAKLTETDLAGADLAGADLTGADLTRAKLEGAKYINEDTEKEVYIELFSESTSTTKFPKEFDPIAAKMLLIKNLNDLI